MHARACPFYKKKVLLKTQFFAPNASRLKNGYLFVSIFTCMYLMSLPFMLPRTHFGLNAYLITSHSFTITIGVVKLIFKGLFMIINPIIFDFVKCEHLSNKTFHPNTWMWFHIHKLPCLSTNQSIYRSSIQIPIIVFFNQ